MVNSVEELLQVDVHDPAPSLAHILAGFEHRLLRASVWAKARSSIPKSSVQRVGSVLDTTPVESGGLSPSGCRTSASLCYQLSVSLPSVPAAVDTCLPTAPL